MYTWTVPLACLERAGEREKEETEREPRTHTCTHARTHAGIHWRKRKTLSQIEGERKRIKKKKKKEIKVWFRLN